MITHEWRNRTDDGELRFIRAHMHGGNWTFQARLKSEEEWTPLDPLPRPDLEKLREIIFNKYQRRRVPYHEVEQIDAMLDATQ